MLPGSLSRYKKTGRASAPSRYSGGRARMIQAQSGQHDRTPSPVPPSVVSIPDDAPLGESLSLAGGNALSANQGSGWLNALAQIAGRGLQAYGTGQTVDRKSAGIQELLGTSDPEQRMKIMEMLTFGNTSES